MVTGLLWQRVLRVVERGSQNAPPMAVLQETV